MARINVAAAFDTCDVEAGDVAVGAVRRELVFFQSTNIGAFIFDARIEGSCPDIYVENFTPGLFVAPGVSASITLVIAATSTGPCEAQLVIDTDAANAPERSLQTGVNSMRVDVRANRVEGVPGVEGRCTPDVACCCDIFTSTRLPPTCGDDDRLACANQAPLLFTDVCDAQCGLAVETSWLRTYPDPTMAGPVLVDGVDFNGNPTGLDDILVLHKEPCAVERIAVSGESMWTTTFLALEACEDMALAGDATVVLTGDGTELIYNPIDASEGATRVNEGRTVAVAAPAPGPAGAVLATHRTGTGDIVVREVSSTGAVSSTFELAGVEPDIASPHVVAALASGDVVVAFARRAGSPPVDLPSVAGGVFTLGDADATVMLQLDDVGLVRRAFVVQSSAAAQLEASGDAYILCGGTQAAGAAVEIGETGSAATALGSFEESRGFFVHVAADEQVTLDVDGTSNSTSSCGFDQASRPFAVATANTTFTLRTVTFVRELAIGRAVAMGATLDETAFVVVAAHGGVAGQEIFPQFPLGSPPLDSGSFVMRIPLAELDL